MASRKKRASASKPSNAITPESGLSISGTCGSPRKRVKSKHEIIVISDSDSDSEVKASHQIDGARRKASREQTGNDATLVNAMPGQLHKSQGPSFQDPTALYVNMTGRISDLCLPTISVSDITSGNPRAFLFTGGMCSSPSHQSFVEPYLPPSCTVTFVANRSPSTMRPWPFRTHFIRVSTDIPGLKNDRGCQHAKLALCLFESHLRVFITSGNFSITEWTHMGQIAWCMDMPRYKNCEQNQIKVGDRVSLHSLVNSTHYNGCVGTCSSHSIKSSESSFVVVIEKERVGGKIKGSVIVKEKNLKKLSQQHLSHLKVSNDHHSSAFSTSSSSLSSLQYSTNAGSHYMNKPHPFAVDLANFLRTIFCGKKPEVLKTWLTAILNEYDFSVCGPNVHLVTSIPGVHIKPERTDNSSEAGDKVTTKTYYGARRLYHLLRTKLPSGFFRKSPWRGKKNMKPRVDSVEGCVSSISWYHYGLHGNLMKAFEGRDHLGWEDMRLFYPSQSRTIFGNKNLKLPPFRLPGYVQNLLFDRNSFKVKFPLRGCEKPCTNPKHQNDNQCRPCLLHEFVPCEAQRPGRVSMPQHAKIFLRESTIDGPHRGRGWIYAGSHNLSGSAWGTSVNPGRNRVNHFELGVLVTDVPIAKYDRVIPWERRTYQMDTLRYQNGQFPWSSD